MNMTDISGIGEATAQRMKTHGIDSVEAVSHASIEQLVAIPGIGRDRAAALKEAANRLLSDATAGAKESDATAGAEESDGAAGPEASSTAQTPAGDGEKPERPKRKKEKKKTRKEKKGKKRKKGETTTKKKKKKDEGRKKRKKRGK